MTASTRLGAEVEKQTKRQRRQCPEKPSCRELQLCGVKYLTMWVGEAYVVCVGPLSLNYVFLRVHTSEGCQKNIQRAKLKDAKAVQPLLPCGPQLLHLLISFNL
ncbi:hypothetical protein EXN66_Car009224 [Channa argus]|uniref:Uncharacterized protein n=1 Tax=Channa argus TaxID=215402 RepID=A0A6G1PU89_CHAAH|nr:hypothetical protein EXN66_Car009224 [Channa argus]